MELTPRACTAPTPTTTDALNLTAFQTAKLLVRPALPIVKIFCPWVFVACNAILNRLPMANYRAVTNRKQARTPEKPKTA